MFQSVVEEKFRVKDKDAPILWWIGALKKNDIEKNKEKIITDTDYIEKN